MGDQILVAAREVRPAPVQRTLPYILAVPCILESPVIRLQNSHPWRLRTRSHLRWTTIVLATS